MITLSINAKCSDRCSYCLINDEGQLVIEGSGYLPKGLHVGGGDYIKLQIDFSTGQILNWPTKEEIEEQLRISDVNSGWE